MRLAIRPGALGDFIVSLPALQALVPDELWVSAANAPLARLLFPQVRPISATGLDLVAIGGPIPPDLHLAAEIVSWYGTNQPDFRAAVAHLPFRFHPALPPPDCPVHATQFYWDQLALPGPVLPPRVPVPPLPRQCLILHPFSGSAKKNWPLEHFRAVAVQSGWPVRWCAGPEEDLPHAVQPADRAALAQFLATGALYLGNDSGVSHLAAAVGTPTIAIFRATDPALWAPVGAQVLINPGLDEVLAAVKGHPAFASNSAQRT